MTDHSRDPLLGQGPTIKLRRHEDADQPGNNPFAWRWEVVGDDDRWIGSGVAESYGAATQAAWGLLRKLASGRND